MNRRIDRTRQAWVGTAVLALGLLTSACADLTRSLAPDPVDQNSAVAAQVKAASKANLPAPKFSDVPPKPTDVRAPAVYKSQVQGVVVARRQLDRWVAANPTLTSDPTEAFAAQAQAAVAGAQASGPSPDDGTAETEAFAERARERAAPPKPLK